MLRNALCFAIAACAPSAWAQSPDITTQSEAVDLDNAIVTGYAERQLLLDAVTKPEAELTRFCR